MNNIRIVVNKIPISASRPRVSRFSAYYSEPYRSYKEEIKEFMTKYMSNEEKLMYPKHEPLHIDIIFYMPIHQ